MPTLLRPPCSALRDLEAEAVDAHDDLVRGRLVDAAGRVGAAPDAGHVARRRHQHRLVRQRVHDLDPRVVERGELGVVARGVHPPLEDLLRQQVRRRVEDRHAVAGALAVGDHLALEVAQLDVVAARGERHHVRHADHRDLVDGGQAAHALAAGDVALEVGRLDVVGGRRRRREGVGAGGRARVRQAAGLGDLDELRGGVDLRREVLAPLLERQALVLLLAGRAGVDDELVGLAVGPAVLAARVRLLGDLDLDGRAVGALERLGLEGLDGLVRRGGQRRHRAAVGAVARRPRARPSTGRRRSGRSRRRSARGTRPP